MHQILTRQILTGEKRQLPVISKRSADKRWMHYGFPYDAAGESANRLFPAEK